MQDLGIVSSVALGVGEDDETLENVPENYLLSFATREADRNEKSSQQPPVGISRTCIPSHGCDKLMMSPSVA